MKLFNTMKLLITVSKTNDHKTMISKCAICGSKYSTFIRKNKKQVEY